MLLVVVDCDGTVGSVVGPWVYDNVRGVGGRRIPWPVGISLDQKSDNKIHATEF